VYTDENDQSYLDHKEKVCLCECEHCAKISPHPVHNCFYKCKNRIKFDEKTLKKLGLY
jgi:hypothetical protein